MLTIAHIFYGQHKMLPLHVNTWQSYTDECKILIVDDGSPDPIKSSPLPGKVDVVRVLEDIPWNIAGARNLAMHAAETEWVLVADIDHIVTLEAFQKILSLDYTDDSIVYTFTRRSVKGKEGCEAIVNFLMNKRRYQEIGGHDEDFSGNYGSEETFFKQVLRAKGFKIDQKCDIVLEWHPVFGKTPSLNRDRSKNARIYASKMEALNNGLYVPGLSCRYKWSKIRV